MSQKIHANFDFKGSEQPQISQPPFQEEDIVEKTEPQYDTDEEEKKGSDDEIFARGIPLIEVR